MPIVDKEQDHNRIIKNLSCFKSTIKYERVYPQILLHGKCAYIIGDNIKGRVEFLNRGFEELVGIPFGKTFEMSENVMDTVISSEINKINKISRTYCDILFYIDKKDILNLLKQNYGSQAKLNKIITTIETTPKIRFNFKPFKKSSSVFESEYILNEPVRICPTYRVNDGTISINTLFLYEILTNELLTNVVKIEINTDKHFVRISCIDGDTNIKFIINQR